MNRLSANKVHIPRLEVGILKRAVKMWITSKKRKAYYKWFIFIDITQPLQKHNHGEHPKSPTAPAGVTTATWTATSDHKSATAPEPPPERFIILSCCKHSSSFRNSHSYMNHATFWWEMEHKLCVLVISIQRWRHLFRNPWIWCFKTLRVQMVRVDRWSRSWFRVPLLCISWLYCRSNLAAYYHPQ